MARSREPTSGRDVDWDFASVFTFLDAYASQRNVAVAEPSIIDLRRSHDIASTPQSLGDFTKLWEQCGKSDHIEPPLPLSSSPSDSSIFDSSDASDSTANTLITIITSSVVDPVTTLDETKQTQYNTRGVKEVFQAEVAKKTQAPTPSEKRRDVINSLVGNDGLIGPSSLKSASSTTYRPRSFLSKANELSDSEDEVPQRSVVGSGNIRVPDVGPLPASQYLLPQCANQSHIIQPIYTLTPSEQLAKLARKLERDLGVSPMFDRPSLETSDHGIHVFVDSSNIVISFIELLKLTRGLQKSSRVKNASFNFRGLAMIMERGRPVARRILVGSKSSSIYRDETSITKRPSHFPDAEICGYEINMLERVLKHKPMTSRKKCINSGNGYATSGYSSGSETRHTPKVMSEQAVDEILHMKLLESLVDTAVPSTIVLATGDAAEAEYSGGFLKNVERALSRGWKVEVIAWRESISREYKSHEFRKRWGNQFKIIELDEYLEELLAVYAVQLR